MIVRLFSLSYDSNFIKKYTINEFIVFGTEKKPSQSNLVEPVLRESRELKKLDNDISEVNDTLTKQNEYDDTQYKSVVKKGNYKSSNSQTKGRLHGLMLVVHLLLDSSRARKAVKYVKQAVNDFDPLTVKNGLDVIDLEMSEIEQKM